MLTAADCEQPISDEVFTERVEFPDNSLVMNLFGVLDSHLKLVEKRWRVSLYPLGNGVSITAPEQQAKKVRQLLETLYAALEQGHTVDEKRVADGIQSLEESELVSVSHTGLSAGSLGVEPLGVESLGVEPMGVEPMGVEPMALESLSLEPILQTPRRAISPRNLRQADYIRTMEVSDLTFAIGPAGTGKTYLAVAAAVVAFMKGEVARIVLTRPAVEAGERLGFLPGDLQAKVDPYLRPLYDALHDMLGSEKVERMLSRNELEIAPLAYMRGRTLEEAFIILDEAQNATTQQMKMFLTRLGAGSKVAVSGDITQLDLPRGVVSGLVQAIGILKHVQEVAFIHFTHRDVVRHVLVRKIVRAYEEAEKQRSLSSM